MTVPQLGLIIFSVLFLGLILVACSTEDDLDISFFIWSFAPIMTVLFLLISIVAPHFILN